MRRSIATGLLLALWSSTPGAGGSGGSLPFRLSIDGDIVVPVTIAGQGPFRFLLDTGSSRSAISVEAAGRLGLVPLTETMMMTPAGQARRSLVRLDGVALGPVPPVTALAMMLPGADLAAGGGIDGLIGQDVLHMLTYTIDYDRRQFIWHAARPDAGPSARLALTRSGGRFLVTLPQPSSGGEPLQLVPDSGADCLVLFSTPGRTLPTLTPADVAVWQTLSGRRLVRSVVIDSLNVGGVGLINQTAVLVDRAAANAPFGDGLLPLHLFSRVTFNGPDRYLIVEGRARRQ